MTERFRAAHPIWCGLLLLAWSLSSAVHATDTGGAAWAALSAPQRNALAPLSGDWANLDPQQRQKWLEIAARFDQLSPAERERVQRRMGEWARLSPAERGQARANFQSAKQLSVDDRQARWEAYQALPEDQRRRLAAQGQAPAPAPGPRTAGAASAPARPAAAAQPRPATAPGATRPKVNTVPDPLSAAAPKPVGPTVVQAKPGASTRLITQQPTPQPEHQQPGMPKIAATSEFVDRKTLLPQRGPQSAGPASAPASR